MVDMEFLEREKQVFLKAVRKAYHDSLSRLTSPEADHFTVIAQESLSLYSPWMSTDPETKKGRR